MPAERAKWPRLFRLLLGDCVLFASVREHVLRRRDVPTVLLIFGPHEVFYLHFVFRVGLRVRARVVEAKPRTAAQLWDVTSRVDGDMELRFTAATSTKNYCFV